MVKDKVESCSSGSAEDKGRDVLSESAERSRSTRKRVYRNQILPAGRVYNLP